MAAKKKIMAMGAVALMAVMAMAAFVVPFGADGSDAAIIGAGTQSSPFTEFDTTAETAYENWGNQTVYIASGTTIHISDVSGSDPCAWEYYVSDRNNLGTQVDGVWSKTITSSTSVKLEYMDEYNNATRTITFEPVAVIDVSDAVIIAGTAYSAIVVPDGYTVTVSGADWLSSNGGIIYGTAPDTPGDYTVTVHCGSASSTFQICVISKIVPTNSPANGVIVFVL